MRFCDLFTSLLLGISVTSVTIASPFDSEGDLQDRITILDARALRLIVVKRPDKDATCPYRARARDGGPYPQHKFTKKLIESAFTKAAYHAADEKQVGDGKYPHDFGGGRVPFPCGKNKMVYPIQTNNHPYGSGSPGNIPDRVVFEYQKTGTDLVVKYCGVMRRGVRGDFLKCT
ncbi:uncharacterized protein CPUR_02967 [Claviceps purpurea 20.1]|uniref:Uncharacterized protein n=1 Tax=Claviceps purpurea (strain 20.1) TaxID=1111077 RepID=M1WD45_CLAP2|nr:uncharacterized protein CPUR_02967 [Claviceps purpurea 20.1]